MNDNKPRIAEAFGVTWADMEDYLGWPFDDLPEQYNQLGTISEAILTRLLIDYAATRSRAVALEHYPAGPSPASGFSTHYYVPDDKIKEATEAIAEYLAGIENGLRVVAELCPPE